MELFDQQILQIAALGVWQIVTGKPMKKRLEPVQDSRWESKSGLFVTLKKDWEVRGSMGILESSTSLAETIFDTAQTAATHDHRHAPLQEHEFQSLDVELTLLEEMKKFQGLDSLQLGRHGLVVSRGEKRAVLLPDIPLEQNWSPEQFLEATCEKAELSHKAWKDPNTLVETFETRTLRAPLLLCLREYI